MATVTPPSGWPKPCSLCFPADERGDRDRRRRLRRRAAGAGVRGGRPRRAARRRRRRSGREAEPRRELHRGRLLGDPRPPRPRARPARHDRLRRAPRARCDPDRAADPALAAARARPLDPPPRGRRHRQAAPQRPPRRPPVDDLPGDDARLPPPDPGAEWAQGGQRLPPRLRAGAGRPRQSRVDDEERHEDRRRDHARLHGGGGEALWLGDRHRPPGLVARGGGALPAAPGHLSLGEHPARERARAALRPDGDRRLGGRRGGGDEAVRVHAVPARTGPRRPLHSDRPLLPDLEGARVRLLHRVHRARREGEREHAVLLPLAHLAGAEPREGAVAQGFPGARPGRGLQGRHRRRARVARAEADRAAAERRLRGRLPRPARARAARRRPALGAARGERLRLRRDRHRALVDRLRPAGGRRVARRRPPQRDRQERLRQRKSLEVVTRVGLAGLGYWGPNLARNFDELAELTWLCETDDGRLRRVAERHPDARSTARFEEMLADPTLDAVVVSTPVPTHYELAKRALEAGKHVFVEKPPAMRAAEMDELVGPSAEGELVLMPGHLLLCYLRFPSGKIAHMHLSWLDPHKMRRITVVGREKMAVFDDMELERKVTVYEKAPWKQVETYGEWQTRSGDIWIPKVATDEPLRLECRHFLRLVEGDGDRAKVAHDGAMVVRALERLTESLAA